MRKLACLLSFVFSLSLFASTGQTQQFNFDGSVRSNSLNLSGTKTHTEYRYEQVRRTCYRQVIVGYRDVCRNVQTGTRCTTRNGNRVCTPVYTRRCTRRPIYRSRPYTCYETVRVPYEVHDYNTLANINFTFAPTPVGVRANENLKVSLNGDSLTTTVESSGKLILLYDKQQSSFMDNGTKVINTNYFIEFVDLEKAIAPMRGGIHLTEITASELVFEAGEMPEDMSYIFKLKLTKKKLFSRNLILINRELNGNDMTVTNLNGRSVIRIKLDNANVDLAKGRYKMAFQTSLDVPADRILNSADIPGLKFDVNRKFKVKKDGTVLIK
jgi:hypothetical protein